MIRTRAPKSRSIGRDQHFGGIRKDDRLGTLRCCWLRVDAKYLHVKPVVWRVFSLGGWLAGEIYREGNFALYDIDKNCGSKSSEFNLCVTFEMEVETHLTPY